jgi:hypothetical protein
VQFCTDERSIVYPKQGMYQARLNGHAPLGLSNAIRLAPKDS